MPAEHTTMKEFTPILQEKMDAKKSFLAVFKGGIDPETGVSWCSDCVKAEPMLAEHLYPVAVAKDIPVIYIDCGLRPEWKNPKNECRTHQVFAMSGVPNVTLVKNGYRVAFLAEDQLFGTKYLELMHSEM
jgi:hypothetical protein